LNNISKHVMASLEDLAALDEVLTMAEIIAGGKEALVDNPVLSLITCVVKSPLQIVAETAQKTIGIAQRRIPLVISSSPMGGTTAPFDEFGMVAQINAEILAGIALTQLVAPGAPVLYGSVPVRCRLDNLNDMYAAPEFVHYNLDCAQMARFYGLPCYSSSGIGDASVPGVQATIEKMLTHGLIPFGGAHYIHYSFGLLERTNVFCPVQAVLDDAQIDLVKRSLQPATVSDDRANEVLGLIREVMATSHRTYVYNLPLPTREPVYVSFPLEDTEHGALYAAHQRYNELAAVPPLALPGDVRKEIAARVPGLLPAALQPPTEDA
jgi:trimethylamine--corrinoid protein Co-methyltransferase